jgi:hypothetical protein
MIACVNFLVYVLPFKLSLFFIYVQVTMLWAKTITIGNEEFQIRRIVVKIISVNAVLVVVTAICVGKAQLKWQFYINLN